MSKKNKFKTQTQNEHLAIGDQFATRVRANEFINYVNELAD